MADAINLTTRVTSDHDVEKDGCFNSSLSLSSAITGKTNASPMTTTKTTTTTTTMTSLTPSFPISESGIAVTHIEGLEYYPNFLTLQEEEQLLHLIDSHPWQSGIIARRQQFYGQVYYHTSYQSSKLQPNHHYHHQSNTAAKCNCNCNCNETTPTPSIPSFQQQEQEQENNVGIPLQESGMKYWLERTSPFFSTSFSKSNTNNSSDNAMTILPSQVLVNEYRNNLGIASHFEDVQAFGDVIVTISLLNPIYMTLKKPIQPTNACDEYQDIVKILLEPRSALIMKDAARYQYRHGIGKSKWVHLPPTTTTTNGTNTTTATNLSIRRDDSYRRISLTIRHLLPTRRQVSQERDEQDTIKDPSVY
jgi:alkylated DNA repair dioxygenase AlkB